jgi:hypothetical protein
VALWPLAVAGVAAVMHAALAPVAPPLPRAARASRAVAQLTPHPYPADSLAALVQAGDVFRLGHRPAPVRYDPATGTGPQSWSPPVSRPALRLVGLIAGPTPVAAIEGLPGIEGGRLLKVGEQLAGYRVTSIEGGRVRVVGRDTVWVLTLRHQ